MQKYEKNELLDLFESLPQELRRAIVSDKTADIIRQVCEKNQVEGDKISETANLIGYSLLGLLSPADLQIELENLKISKQQSEKMANEFVAKIFYPLKEILLVFYPTAKFTPEQKIMKKQIVEEKEIGNSQQKETVLNPNPQDTEAQDADDSYREPL